MKKFLLATLILTSIYFIPNQASAFLIVDTGTQANSYGGWSLKGDTQGLAGEFSVNNSYTITDVSSFMGIQKAGSVDIVLYGGTSPGFYNSKVIPNDSNELYRKNVVFNTTTTGTTVNEWFSFSGLNWSVTPGLYWVALESPQADTFIGWLPGDTSNPLAHYATYWPLTDKYTGFDSDPKLGFRRYNPITNLQWNS